MEFDVLLKLVGLMNLLLILSLLINNQGREAYLSKHFSIGWHLDIYISISFLTC